MILSSSLDSSDWYIGEEERGTKEIQGLGYLSFQVYPHFEEKFLPEILKKRNHGLNYLLLKDGEAFSYDGQVMKFYGEKNLYPRDDIDNLRPTS